MKPRIFMLGNNVGSYRTQNFVNAIFQNQCGELYYNDYRNRKSGIIRFFENMFTRLEKISCLKKSDIIYVCIMQHDSKYLKLSKRLKKRVITEFYISLYDTYVNDRKTVAADSKEAKRLLELDRFALLKSDLVLFLNKAEAEYYCKVVNVDLRNVSHAIVPLCNNKKEPVKLKYFRGQRDYLSLCWTGTYIPLQGLDKIINAMKLLKEKGIAFKLNIWGDSDEKAIPFLALVKEYKLDDYINFHNEWGNMDKWEAWMVENCDVNLGIFGDSAKAKTVVANKVVDGISFQAPVITAYSKGISEYFNSEEDIFIVDNTPEAIAEEIEKISKLDITQIEARIINATKIYEKEFSIKSYNKRVQEIIDFISVNSE